MKIRKHGKKKNDKDEIGNILFKTRFYQSIVTLNPPMGCAHNNNIKKILHTLREIL